MNDDGIVPVHWRLVSILVATKREAQTSNIPPQLHANYMGIYFLSIYGIAISMQLKWKSAYIKTENDYTLARAKTSRFLWGLPLGAD